MMELYLKIEKIDVCATALYYPEEKRFIVKKGAKVSEKISDAPTFRGAKSIMKARDGVVVDRITNLDVEFKSPSTAGNFITGRSTDGMKVWKSKEGICLKQLLSENPK